MIAIKGTVTGRVQGVGFRYFTQENAVLAGIHGYVRNNVDTSVEFVFQGPEHDVWSLLEKIKQGPTFSRVDSCEFQETDVSDSLTSFEITY